MSTERLLDGASACARRAGGPTHLGRRGSALLAVLWLSAALAAIGLALSSTVRGELDRVGTAADGLRSYYLACGAIERAAVEVLWSVQTPDKRLIPRASPSIDYHFPSGDVHVQFIPEAAKLNVNTAPVEELYRLIGALGLPPGQAEEVTAAIDDYRRSSPEGSPLDQYYLGLKSSFRARHASLEEIEELLLVKGVTPEIFYGGYVPASEGGGGLVARPGLIDCLSVYGAKDRIDANAAQPAVLAAVGVAPGDVSAILQRRQQGPTTDDKQPGDYLGSLSSGSSRLRVEGNSIVTIKATARLRLLNGQLSDLRRTVGAQVKYMPPGYDSLIHILRWYDTAWSN